MRTIGRVFYKSLSGALDKYKREQHAVESAYCTAPTTQANVACEQAHLIGKGGGAAIASRRGRREEWGEEK